MCRGESESRRGRKETGSEKTEWWGEGVTGRDTEGAAEEEARGGKAKGSGQCQGTQLGLRTERLSPAPPILREAGVSDEVVPPLLHPGPEPVSPAGPICPGLAGQVPTVG